MSHERYYLEDRLRVPFSRSIPSEARSQGIGDNADGADSVYIHKTNQGEAVLIPGVNVFEAEVAELEKRGAVFPLETKFPTKGTLYNQEGEITQFPMETAQPMKPEGY